MADSDFIAFARAAILDLLAVAQGLEKENEELMAERSTLGEALKAELAVKSAASQMASDAFVDLEKENAQLKRQLKETMKVVEHEIKLADKQIELLKLRMEEEPRNAEAIRPFGSNLWRMTERLKKLATRITEIEKL